MRNNDKHRAIFRSYVALRKTTAEEYPDMAQYIAMEYYYLTVANEWSMKKDSIKKIIRRQLKKNTNSSIRNLD